EASSTSTSLKARATHANAKLNIVSTNKELREKREAEAKECVEDSLVRDAAVIDAAVPRDPDTAKFASKVADMVVKQLETIISTKDMSAESFIKWVGQDTQTESDKPKWQREPDMYPHISSFLQRVQEYISAAASSLSTETQPIQQARTLMTYEGADKNPTGSDDYTRIDFGIKLSELNSDSKHETLQQNENAIPIADAAGKVGVSTWPIVKEHMAPPPPPPLHRRHSPKTDSKKPDYKHILAIVEAKRFENDQTNAFEQLFIYNRNLYANQLNRRFTWGFTVCNSIVHACVFSHNNIFASPAMDVSEADGRRRFVNLLVNMAFCETDMLGYDPTIRIDPEQHCGEIDVYDDSSRQVHTYKYIATLLSSTSNFGRHTRCYLCEDPSIPGSSIVIKDAWAHGINSASALVEERFPGLNISEQLNEPSAMPVAFKEQPSSSNAPFAQRADDRDEIKYMREISQKLGDDPELKGKFPMLKHGGIVHIPGINTADNTATAFERLTSGETHHRVHRRIAMTPNCMPLQNIKSVDKLIVVVADVMIVHNAIAERCSILHRDISIYNIMYTSISDDIVRGVLVDFDCAKRTDVEEAALRPERTGTFPYMSINNLLASNVKRTQLDDWESLLYVLCWLGTTGINKDDEVTYEEAAKLAVAKWQGANAESVALAKRGNLSGPQVFESSILSEFLDESGYGILSDLAYSLYMSLFFNKSISVLAHGVANNTTRILKSYEDSNVVSVAEIDKHATVGTKGRVVDPFAVRAKPEFEKKIVKDLLEIIKKARTDALLRIKEYNSLL
ncbi:hypothetical protein LPJ57_005265, partial [Coemansia sp. RSA 486]